MRGFDRDWLLRPIVGALGWGALLGTQACGGGVEPPGPLASSSGGGVSGSGGGAGTASGGQSSGGQSSDDTGAGVTSAGGASAAAGSGGASSVPFWSWNLDPGSTAEPPVESPCIGVPGDDPEWSFAELAARAFCGDRLPSDYVYDAVCFPAPTGGASCAQAYPLADVANLFACGHDDQAAYVCGPQPPQPGGAQCGGDECCFVMAGGCAVGRPFIVAGEARRAELCSRHDWLGPSGAHAHPDVSTLDPDTRLALADVYAEDALTEHASVASFARFVLECLALGAPADLLLEAQRALSDEIEHARASFALASAYAGRPLGPSPLDVSRALPASTSLLDSLRRTLREGCIAETVSAALIRAAAEAARDPAVRVVLHRVADDECRHAALAWRFASWALARGGEEAAEVVRAELGRAHEHVGFGPLARWPGDATALRAHGCLGMEERRQIARLTLARVIGPSARLLLRGTAPRSQTAGARGVAIACAV